MTGQAVHSDMASHPRKFESSTLPLLNNLLDANNAPTLSEYNLCIKLIIHLQNTNLPGEPRLSEICRPSSPFSHF